VVVGTVEKRYLHTFIAFRGAPPPGRPTACPNTLEPSRGHSLTPACFARKDGLKSGMEGQSPFLRGSVGRRRMRRGRMGRQC